MASSDRASCLAAGRLWPIALGLQGGAQQHGRRAQHRRPAQQTPPQPPPPADPTQPPVFRTGINFVRVDVIVSDKNGNPVADLKQADFEVTEDGKPQNIETFKLVKLDGGTRADADQGPATRDPHRLRRRGRSGARRRAAVRDLPGRLSRAPGVEPRRRASQLVAVHRDAARPVRHDRRDVPARVDRRRCG